MIRRIFIGTFSGNCATRRYTSSNPSRNIKCSMSSAGSSVKCSRTWSRSSFSRPRTVAAYFLPASSPSTSTCHSMPMRLANLIKGFNPDWANSITLIPSASKWCPHCRASSLITQVSVSPSTRSQQRANSADARLKRIWKAIRRPSSAFMPPGPSRHAATREDSLTRRHTCSTGVSESSSPELVVVICCNGSKLSNCQATESIMGCSRVSGSSTNRSGRASRSRRTVPLACNNVAKKPNRMTRYIRPPGLSIIRLMISR